MRKMQYITHTWTNCKTRDDRSAFTLFITPQMNAPDVDHITNWERHFFVISLNLPETTLSSSCAPDRVFCGSPDVAQVQLLKGLGFVGHPCSGNSTPSCCFAVGSLHWAFASSKSHWKIWTDIIMHKYYDMSYYTSPPRVSRSLIIPTAIHLFYYVSIEIIKKSLFYKDDIVILCCFEVFRSINWCLIVAVVCSHHLNCIEAANTLHLALPHLA